VDLIVSVYSYCANLQQRNMHRYNETVFNREFLFGKETAQRFQAIFNVTEAIMHTMLEHRQERSGFEDEQLSTCLKLKHNMSTSWFPFSYEEKAHELFPKDTKMRIWPPLAGNKNEKHAWLLPESVTKRDPLPLDQNVSAIGYYPYVRATRSTQTDGSDFSLYAWFVEVIDWITGLNLSETLVQNSLDFQSFVLNPNYKCPDYPNIGLLFYVMFTVRCDFPCNVDCRYGMGLESALGRVLLWYGIALLVCVIFFQSGLGILISTITLFIMFVIVMMGMAWGFSARCLFLQPTPFPVSMIFPFCAIDDTLALLDKWINDCYDFLWPQYMLQSAAVCPGCPNKFAFTNCLRDLRLGDGLSNWFFLFYYWGGPSFCNVIQAFANSINWLLPWAPNYVQYQCTNYMSPDPTIQDRLWWCWWSTIPSLILPSILAIIGATFIGFVIPQIWNILLSLWFVFITSPLGLLITTAQNAFNPSNNDNNDDDDDAEETKNIDSAFHMGIKMLGKAFVNNIYYYQVKKFKDKKD
jgi:hypothetical protein